MIKHYNTKIHIFILFNKYKLKYSKLEQFVSQPRLNRFLTACGSSKVKAQKLYRINLRISKESYPLLTLFEIFLRNAINGQLSIYFNDTDWIVNQKSSFMSNNSLNSSRFQMRTSVQKAENTIRQKGSTVTAGKVIAEQTFGFWTSLFENHHYRLVGGSPIQCFANKPPQANRSIIATKLNEIRLFRNRIYHNEPVCFLHNAVDFSHVQQTVQTIYELLNWIDADLATYANSYDHINRIIMAGNNL